MSRPATKISPTKHAETFAQHGISIALFLSRKDARGGTPGLQVFWRLCRAYLMAIGGGFGGRRMDSTARCRNGAEHRFGIDRQGLQPEQLRNARLPGRHASG